MCENYIEMSKGHELIEARRRIWPANVHLLLGVSNAGSPQAVVMADDDGSWRKPVYLRFGMNLILNRETVIFGWCPPIDDVMGQDWEFIREK
jgi:hypothetical protein